MFNGEYDKGSYRPESYESQPEDAKLAMGPPKRRVNIERRVSATGSTKTAQMFASGGALDSQTTNSHGEAIDITHAFDPVTSYVTPATPDDDRTAFDPQSQALDDGEGDETWVSTQPQDEETAGNHAKAINDGPTLLLATDGANKENIPPKAERVGVVCEGCRDTFAAMLGCFEEIVAFQNRSAISLDQQADAARESAAYLASLIKPITMMLAGSNADDVILTEEEIAAGIVLYMGYKARPIQEGHWVTYLHAYEDTQEVIGMERIPDLAEIPKVLGKRPGLSDTDEEIDSVSAIGSDESDDDLPALEPLEESDGVGGRFGKVKIHPVFMYMRGDLPEEWYNGPGY
ncbi:hypothetical protein QCA50_007306 [Cerrena zonata]|uniref:Uncharacterized protein n=1 Tax=Cerrena zonata TaxID=2478898 RepID=A0AAW0GID8_9APHY